MSLNKNNLDKLLKLSEHLNKFTIVFPQGSDMVEFETLQSMINKIYDHSIDVYIPEFDTYYISNVGIQNSLLNDNDDILIIYMI